MNKLLVESLTVRYQIGNQLLTAVDQADVVVPAGGTTGLVGESGCGKSTLARAVVGLVPVAGGRLVFEGQDVTEDRARNDLAYRRRVQMVFQDPFASLNPRMTVGEALEEAIFTRAQKLSRAARRAEIARLLGIVGLPDDADEGYPHQFSGGQRQRIAIARALAVGPELIVMDEVTSSLDVSVQATTLNLLRSLQRDFGLSYLYISHDLSVVRYMSDVTTVMYLGQVVETGPTEEIFGKPYHPYTRGLLASIPRLGAAGLKAGVMGDIPSPLHPPSGCRFRTRCPIGPMFHAERTICIEKDPQEIAASQPHSAACHFAGLVEEPPTPQAMLQMSEERVVTS